MSKATNTPECYVDEKDDIKAEFLFFWIAQHLRRTDINNCRCPLRGGDHPFARGPGGARQFRSGACASRRSTCRTDHCRYATSGNRAVNVSLDFPFVIGLDRTLKTMPNGLRNVDQYCRIFLNSVAIRAPIGAC
jgi:hypothetical protein